MKIGIHNQKLDERALVTKEHQYERAGSTIKSRMMELDTVTKVEVADETTKDASLSLCASHLKASQGKLKHPRTQESATLGTVPDMETRTVAAVVAVGPRMVHEELQLVPAAEPGLAQVQARATRTSVQIPIVEWK